MKIWLVIGSDVDGAWIDKDCVFEFKSLAEEKAAKLREAYDDQMVFSVVDIDTPCDQEAAIYAVADSIRANADALMAFSDNVKELINCACTDNAMGEGHQATHPTVIIKKGEN